MAKILIKKDLSAGLFAEVLLRYYFCPMIRLKYDEETALSLVDFRVMCFVLGA